MGIKAGDLVAFSGANYVSDMVNLATWGLPRWGISHVGIVAKVDDRLLLFEATTLGEVPCEITGVPFNGTQAHSLNFGGYKGRVWYYPLYRELYERESTRLTAYLISILQTPYDDLGALRSARLSFLGQDLTSLFCSELVAAAYANIGILPSNASRWNPNCLVRLLRKRAILRKPIRVRK